MKHSSFSKRRSRQAFTLTETLVVLFIVFVLVAIIFPWGPRPRRPVKIIETRVEISCIVGAIEAYRKSYGRYPVPTNIEVAALTAKEDFTYGGPLLDAILGPGSSTPVNADVIAILMDLTNNPNGRLTVNSNNNLNSQRIIFLNAKFTGNTNDPGVGTDLVYRDPWGHPYIISLDLNGDKRCRDAFYMNHLVSRKDGATGFDGLTDAIDASGTNDLFEYEGGVMVWSLGPDGKADKSKPSISPPNKDNVTSWR
jgi:type II secretory pathway pseudopilin PulG